MIAKCFRTPGTQPATQAHSHKVSMKIVFSLNVTSGVNIKLCKIGDFPRFLSALASNNLFIIKLVKMWPGGTLHVVVGTLKMSLDRLKHKKEFCRVL